MKERGGVAHVGLTAGEQQAINCEPKGEAVVLLTCPSRVRTDVHGAVVDGLHTATVVWLSEL